MSVERPPDSSESGGCSGVVPPSFVLSLSSSGVDSRLCKHPGRYLGVDVGEGIGEEDAGGGGDESGESRLGIGRTARAGRVLTVEPVEGTLDGSGTMGWESG